MGTSYIVLNCPLPSDEYINSLLTEKFAENTTKNGMVNNPDINIVELAEDKKSIGIAEIKKGITFLNEKPFFLKHRILIVKTSEKMTAEAQNSLLKTLEEPNSTSVIFLFTQNEGNLLPTVVSRCKKIVFKQIPAPVVPKQESILDLKIGDRLEIADRLSKEEKDSVITELRHIQEAARSRIKFLATPQDKIKYSQALNRIEERIREIEKLNISLKLAVEELFINI